MAQFLGMTDCPYNKGKIGEVDHRCCGGRITKYAVLKCEKKGRIVANDECKKKCVHYGKVMANNSGSAQAEPMERSLPEAGNTEQKSNAAMISSQNKKMPTPELNKNHFGPQNIQGKPVVSNHKSVWKQWAEEMSANGLPQ